MKNFFITCACLLLPISGSASDWGGTSAPIDRMYVYPGYVVVIQGNAYSGAAGCRNDNGWSFYWSDLDADIRKRVYATLLAAKLAKTPIMPIFSDSGCGPEGYKKFNAELVL